MNPITTHGEREHRKASERYVDLTFNYDDAPPWVGSIPVEYRRTGTDLTDPDEVAEYLLQARDQCHPKNWDGWRAEQETFWQTMPNADVTKAIFDTLTSFTWQCVESDLPRNPNFARRVQTLKELGYTISTHLAMFCATCGRNKTHLLLVPLPRGGISGYEAWSPVLRDRIIKVLKAYDAFEGRSVNKNSLLPDHKFPEIRWDAETRREAEELEKLADDEIRRDFQLLSNQRNLQKREVCRQCFQTAERGYPFGIRYYSQGDHRWPAGVPRTGKDAERGCHGCGWYDIEAWRTALAALAWEDADWRRSSGK